jgi:hypothetical protein
MPMQALARAVSLVFNPMVYATLYCAFFSWRGRDPRAWAAPWCLIVAIPAALLFAGLRLGWWSDPDVTALAERRTYLPWAATSAALGAAVALASRAPYAVRLSALAIALWLAASAAVSQFWKVSLHVGGTTGVVGLLWLLAGPASGAALLWTPLLVGWARLRLRRHDLGQVVGGIALGTAAVVAAHALLA